MRLWQQSWLGGGRPFRRVQVRSRLRWFALCVYSLDEAKDAQERSSKDAVIASCQYQLPKPCSPSSQSSDEA